MQEAIKIPGTGAIIIRATTLRGGLSAGQWELFTDMRGAEQCAERLNTRLRYCVDNFSDKQAAIHYMTKCMYAERQAKYGAADSEPMRIMEDVLGEIYP